MSESKERRLKRGKFSRIRLAVGIGVGLALIPAALFAATTAQPVGQENMIRAQATGTPKATATATAAPKTTATAAATPKAPSTGSGGFAQDAGSNSAIAVLLLATAAGALVVGGRLVTRRRSQ